MVDYPRIQRGMGNLTPQVFNQIMGQLEDLSNSQAPTGSGFQQTGARPFLAVLTSATQLTTIDDYSSTGYGFTWLYEWKEVELDYTDRIAPPNQCDPSKRKVGYRIKLDSSGAAAQVGVIGTSSEDCTAATNLLEINNSTASKVVGPGMVLDANTVALEIGNDANLMPQVVLMHSFSYRRTRYGEATGTCFKTDTFYVFSQDSPLDCSTSSFRSSTFTFGNDLGSDWGVLRDYEVDLGAFV